MTTKKELDDIGGAWDLAMYRIEIAKEDLLAAKTLFENRGYRIANNRAYYAIFHALSACLAIEFKGFKSHGQTIGQFNKDFIHTGKFPSEWSKKITKAQLIRNASDYEDFYIVSIEDTKMQIETAEEVVTLIEKYLAEQKGNKNG